MLNVHLSMKLIKYLFALYPFSTRTVAKRQIFGRLAQLYSHWCMEVFRIWQTMFHLFMRKSKMID